MLALPAREIRSTHGSCAAPLMRRHCAGPRPCRSRSGSGSTPAMSWCERLAAICTWTTQRLFQDRRARRVKGHPVFPTRGHRKLPTLGWSANGCRLFGAHQSGLELVLEPVGVAPDVVMSEELSIWVGRRSLRSSPCRTARPALGVTERVRVAVSLPLLPPLLGTAQRRRDVKDRTESASWRRLGHHELCTQGIDVVVRMVVGFLEPHVAQHYFSAHC